MRYYIIWGHSSDFVTYFQAECVCLWVKQCIQGVLPTPTHTTARHHPWYMGNYCYTSIPPPHSTTTTTLHYHHHTPLHPPHSTTTTTLNQHHCHRHTPLLPHPTTTMPQYCHAPLLPCPTLPLQCRCGPYWYTDCHSNHDGDDCGEGGDQRLQLCHADEGQQEPHGADRGGAAGTLLSLQ